VVIEREDMSDKYEDMDDDVLDRLSATRTMGWIQRKRGGFYSNYMHDETMKSIAFHQNLWHPTNPNANQCERYLFPKLIGDKSIVIETAITDTSFIIDITLHKQDKAIKLAQVNSLVQDANRTKTIACLKAWDKLEETV